MYRALERYDLPNTAGNILSMQQLMYNPNAAMRRLFGKNDKIKDLESAKAELLRQFGEAAEAPEDMAKAQQKLAETAENVMKTMIAEGGAESSLDVRELRLMTGQLRLAVQTAKNEEYHIPVLVQGESGEMTLKIVNGKKEKGMVDISLSIEAIGSVAAKLKCGGGRISGFVAADREDTRQKLSSLDEVLSAELKSAGRAEEANISYIRDEGLDIRRFNASVDEENEGIERETGDSVNTRTLYLISKSFLKVINEL